jgi:hypothetical protein
MTTLNQVVRKNVELFRENGSAERKRGSRRTTKTTVEVVNNVMEDGSYGNNSIHVREQIQK